MSELCFIHGTMGSSKTAQALMTKFDYEEKGFCVALMKPAVDTRGGQFVVTSRIGLQAPCYSISLQEDLYEWYQTHRHYQVIILDEAQFLHPNQVDQLKRIAIEGVSVLCYGLKTDFQTKLFPASQRLLEIADSVQEMTAVCSCGKKAEVNARILNGKIVKEGEQIHLGGNESYRSICYRCWLEGRIKPEDCKKKRDVGKII